MKCLQWWIGCSVLHQGERKGHDDKPGFGGGAAEASSSYTHTRFGVEHVQVHANA